MQLKLTVVVVFVHFQLISSQNHWTSSQGQGCGQQNTGNSQYQYKAEYHQNGFDYQTDGNQPSAGSGGQQPNYGSVSPGQGPSDCASEGQNCQSIDDCCEGLQCVQNLYMADDVVMECQRINDQRSSPERGWSWSGSGSRSGDGGNQPQQPGQRPNQRPEVSRPNQRPGASTGQGSGDCVGEGQNCQSIDDCCKGLQCVQDMYMADEIRMECRRINDQRSSPERGWSWSGSGSSSGYQPGQRPGGGRPNQRPGASPGQGSSDCAGEHQDCQSIDDCCEGLQCVQDLYMADAIRMECRRIQDQGSNQSPGGGQRPGAGRPGQRPGQSSGGGQPGQDYPMNKSRVYTPRLQDVAYHLNRRLRKYYQHVQVSVAQCPDLKRSPYNMVKSGLSGNEKVADVGGMGHLLPLPNLEKKYSMRIIARQMGMQEAFFFGAGPGPYHVLGFNTEMWPSVFVQNRAAVINKSKYVKIAESGNIAIGPVNSDEFSLMMNLYVSEGKPGQVLKVVAKRRIGDEIGFPVAIRTALNEAYPGRTCSVGGVFLVKNGRVRVHVMPDQFSEEPLETQEQIDAWFTKFELTARRDSPLTCLTVLNSNDPGLGLRTDHTHCVGVNQNSQQGGHYYTDTSPNEIEYEGYFSLAKEVYRFDQPPETIQL